MGRARTGAYGRERGLDGDLRGDCKRIQRISGRCPAAYHGCVEITPRILACVSDPNPAAAVEACWTAPE